MIMFTGLIERIGKLESIEVAATGGCLRVRLASPWKAPLAPGESVAVDGACLTVTACDHTVFSFDVLQETLDRTVLGTRTAGSPLNLERAMRADGRFGGHMVSGHVDGMGTVSDIRRAGRDFVVAVTCPGALLQDVIVKGSVALNGISLTVTATSQAAFEVHIIPHTWNHTTLSGIRPGDTLNIETDMVAKYIRGYLERKSAEHPQSLTLDELHEAGF